MSLKEIGISLSKNNVEYLWIGGDAVMYHGVNRGSLDHDIWIPEDDSTAENVTASLAELGYIDAPQETISHQKRTYSWPEFLITKTVHGFTHDSFKKLNVFCTNEFNQLEFDDAFNRPDRELIDEEHEAYFISKQDLIQMKQKAGREKDLRDVELLTENEANEY